MVALSIDIYDTKAPTKIRHQFQSREAGHIGTWSIKLKQNYYNTHCL